ncbi:MAG: hypothetical protein QGG40_20465, partial [Myxococcota bacterium]|nr:hypothetical protein [Myxococcota bacterium]
MFGIRWVWVWCLGGAALLVGGCRFSPALDDTGDTSPAVESANPLDTSDSGETSDTDESGDSGGDSGQASESFEIGCDGDFALNGGTLSEEFAG